VRERNGKVLFHDHPIPAPLRLDDGGILVAA